MGRRQRLRRLLDTRRPERHCPAEGRLPVPPVSGGVVPDSARPPRWLHEGTAGVHVGATESTPLQRPLNSSGNRTANVRASSVSGMSNCSIGDPKYDKICIWESDDDITCDIVDGAALLDDARRSVRTEDGGESAALLPPPSQAPRIAKSSGCPRR
ncbi:hypothetical protein VPH35_027384 [Triticum aestivum]|uniref:Uncharacterized protein n=1 Tax=Triticum turgidum subsp. durum TaxID=4567 RepID=A0A9R1PG96_TRITD|nr:unnamed protein product [Triticum turgidum subsp. durum]